MTVAELIAELQKLPQDLTVFVDHADGPSEISNAKQDKLYYRQFYGVKATQMPGFDEFDAALLEW